MPSQADLIATRKHVDQTLAALRSDREGWMDHWGQIAELVLPRRYRAFISAKQSRGGEINRKILSGIGTQAAKVCGSGLFSGMVSPARPWFGAGLFGGLDRDSKPVKIWLDEVTKILRTVFAQSNYYGAKATQMMDLPVFGTSPLIMYEDFDNVITCQVPTQGEFFIGLSNRMVPNRLYREFDWTVDQVVTEFGKDACSVHVQEAAARGGQALHMGVMVHHAIEENRAPWVVPQRFPWREVYWERAGEPGKCLRYRGFHEQPFSAPRWDVSGNDAYGRCPGMDALADVRQLMAMMKRRALREEKINDPPLLADLTMKNSATSLLPGSVSYAPDIGPARGVRPMYEIRQGSSEITEIITELRDIINRAFHVDLFMMISNLDSVRTATEIDARRGELILQLGPVWDRLQKESLSPDLERAYGIALRAGILPPPPPEIQGVDIEFRFIGMLEMAQRAAGTVALERIAGLVGNLAGAVPHALDKVDWDALIDEYGEGLSVAAKVLRDAKALEQMRQQRQQAAQGQQSMDMGMAAVQGAKLLSETDLGGGQNALAAMVGGV